jgi:hypothetical protein
MHKVYSSSKKKKWSLSDSIGLRIADLSSSAIKKIRYKKIHLHAATVSVVLFEPQSSDGETLPGTFAPIASLAIKAQATARSTRVQLAVRWLKQCFDGRLCDATKRSRPPFSCMARASSEYIAEAETLLAETKAHVEEERLIIVRRRELGSDLTESLALLENLESTLRRRERRLASLRHWAKLMDKLGGFRPA